MSTHIIVYISGHGYGHLAQIAPVLNALAAKIPRLQYIIRSDLSEHLIRCRLHARFTLLNGAVDVGVVQKNAIHEDIPATITAAHDFYGDFSSKIDAEISRLRPFHPALILSDISPLAFPVAKKLGIPSIAIANLDWHEIYRDFLPENDAALDILQAAHADCDLLIQPPLCMPMPGFPERSKVELIVEKLPEMQHNMKKRQKTALIMFGGAGDPPFDRHALKNMPDWQFLSLSALPSSTPANIRQAEMYGFSASTAALMRHCDVVITKPGYGTIAECWLTGTPLIYLARKSFAEYPYLDAWLRAYAPSTQISAKDFVSGNWLASMQEALNCTRNYPNSGKSGASQAAELIAAQMP